MSANPRLGERGDPFLGIWQLLIHLAHEGHQGMPVCPRTGRSDRIGAMLPHASAL